MNDHSIIENVSNRKEIYEKKNLNFSDEKLLNLYKTIKQVNEYPVDISSNNVPKDISEVFLNELRSSKNDISKAFNYYSRINVINSFQEQSCTKEDVALVGKGIKLLNNVYIGMKDRFASTPELLLESFNIVNENIDSIKHILSLRNDFLTIPLGMEIAIKMLKYSNDSKTRANALSLVNQNINLLSNSYDFKGENINELISENEFENNPGLKNDVLRKINQIEIFQNVNNAINNHDNVAYEKIENFIQKFNLNPHKITAAWFESYKEQPEVSFNENLQAILILEELRPGICLELNKKFSINNFGRYPKDVLIEQYDQRDNLDLKYGLLVYPYSDHNGAFMEGTKKEIQMLADETKKQNYTLRIVEIASSIELLRNLINFNWKYGSQNKIGFGLIAGHGEGDNIAFGPSNKEINDEKETHWQKGKLNSIDIFNSLAINNKKLQEFFVPNPTIILDSCSTGEKNGIAQLISDKLNVTTIAPSISTTGLSKIKSKFNEHGQLDFDLEFGIPWDEMLNQNVMEDRKYKSGVLIKNTTEEN